MNITSQILKQMFITAKNNIELEKEELNDINVFPVKDGDTGINISMTIKAIIKELETTNEDISKLDAARAVAETALRTAATKEDYIPAFEQYIAALEDEVPEATLDTVVLKLDDLIAAVREMDYNNVRMT